MIYVYNNKAYTPYSNNINKVLLNTNDSIHDILGVFYPMEYISDAHSFLNIKNQYKLLPGIYGIYCIIMGKFYIGSAFDLAYRLTQHLKWYHCSSDALTTALNTYGLDNFQVVIFKTLPSSDFVDKKQFEIALAYEEQWFFDNVEADRLFNKILSSAPIGSGFSRPVSEITKLKISEGNKGIKAKGENPYAKLTPLIDLHSVNHSNVLTFTSRREASEFLGMNYDSFLYRISKARDLRHKLIIDNRWEVHY